MNLTVEAYTEQTARWPKAGRHILAQFDEAGIVVYQAFRPEIAEYAVAHQRFGGPFSLKRMSWIKPNFLWMMYRCGWASKPDQERVLAVTLKREAFDAFLAEAVPSSYVPQLYATSDDWQDAVRKSDVRLQWDPDHGPTGGPLERRAIQLGLRDGALRRYAGSALLRIEDVTAFVREQHEHVRGRDRLLTPREEVYPVPAPLRPRLGIAEEGE